MGSVVTVVKCTRCSAVLDAPSDVPIEQRTPCPSCGSTARQFEVDITETIALHDSMGLKARHGPTGRPFFEAKAGADLHRRSGKWMQRDIVVDRDNDRYLERIIDPQTGAVVHECEEPLTQHRGHGSARRKREGNDG